MNKSSYEELLFAICQEIKGNAFKRTCFYQALEHYIKEWKIRTTRSITSSIEEDAHHILPGSGIGSIFLPQNVDFSFTTPMETLREFLSNILRTLKTLSSDVEFCLQWSNTAISNLDRYQTDFEEICPIGSGGFGNVFRVRHRLDGKEYAVKKVPLKIASSTEYAALLREVGFLSKMNHPNIAHYYSSWMQFDYLLSTSRSSAADVFSHSSDDGQPTSDFMDSLSGRENRSSRLEEGFVSSTSFSSSIVFEGDSHSSLNNAESEKKSQGQFSGRRHHVSLSGRSLGDSMEELSLSSVGAQAINVRIAASCQSRCTQVHKEIEKSLVSYRQEGSSTIVKIPTLYIQMELGSDSLLNWIHRRNERAYKHTFSWTKREMKRHLKIFMDILSAVEYIHTKAIVHRDIKPANILISSDDTILLADFGLAKFILVADLSHKKQGRKCKKGRASTFIGTPPYSAPEMIRNGSYDTKVDIYSLGIILLELLCPFGSMSERARTIERLKKERQLTPNMIKEWGFYAELVMAMTNVDPECRPSASLILQKIRIKHGEPSRKWRSSSSSDLRSWHLWLCEESSLRRSSTCPQSSTFFPYEMSKSRRKRVSRSNSTSGKVSFCTTRKLVSPPPFSSMDKREKEVKYLKKKIKKLERRIEFLEKRENYIK